MIQRGEKRNSEDETAGGDLVDQVQLQGAGGRQANPAPMGWGGGYQDICSASNFGAADEKKRDPRLDELRTMGMPSIWMRVAENIGFDAFLAMWRILDADESIRGDRMIQAHIRPYNSFLRFQRNRYIESLVSLKIPSQKIRAMLLSQLGEDISERHISRLGK